MSTTQLDLFDIDSGVLDTPMPPDDACVNYDQCGNTVLGAGMICANCLDKARHDDVSADE
jgi:hypothetical protein